MKKEEPRLDWDDKERKWKRLTPEQILKERDIKEMCMQEMRRRRKMKFCYIKDLNIPWFVGMVERSNRLPDAVSYDDTYVYISEKEEDI